MEETANSYSGRYDSVVSCRTDVLYAVDYTGASTTLMTNRNSGLLRNGLTVKTET